MKETRSSSAHRANWPTAPRYGPWPRGPALELTESGSRIQPARVRASRRPERSRPRRGSESQAPEEQDFVASDNLTIDKYKLVNCIATGQATQIWEAVDSETTRR